jgi:hypothetical protein
MNMPIISSAVATTERMLDRRKIAASMLFADYKARGLSRHQAWGQFVRDRGLNPEIGAKQAYDLFEQVGASALSSR